MGTDGPESLALGGGSKKSCLAEINVFRALLGLLSERWGWGGTAACSEVGGCECAKGRGRGRVSSRGSQHRSN